MARLNGGVGDNPTTVMPSRRLASAPVLSGTFLAIAWGAGLYRDLAAHAMARGVTGRRRPRPRRDYGEPGLARCGTAQDRPGGNQLARRAGLPPRAAVTCGYAWPTDAAEYYVGFTGDHCFLVLGQQRPRPGRRIAARRGVLAVFSGLAS